MKKGRFATKVTLLTAAVLAAMEAFFVCGGSGLGADASDGPGGSSQIAVGTSCIQSDPKHICLGLKYVVFSDPQGNPVASQADALNNLALINSLHAQCDIGFQIEEFDVVDPTRFGLVFSISNMSDLDGIRSRFGDSSRLLVVTTGGWNRKGSLGTTSANAWTSMPGSPPYGAVLEASVATYPYIFAHEIGHYLSLDHVSDTTDLMNPIIYTHSKVLTPSQCESERSAAADFWNRITRRG